MLNHVESVMVRSMKTGTPPSEPQTGVEISQPALPPDPEAQEILDEVERRLVESGHIAPLTPEQRRSAVVETPDEFANRCVASGHLAPHVSSAWAGISALLGLTADVRVNGVKVVYRHTAILLQGGLADDLERPRWAASHDHDAEDNYSHITVTTAATPMQAIETCFAEVERWEGWS